jgi:hypothetical protein
VTHFARNRTGHAAFRRLGGVSDEVIQEHGRVKLGGGSTNRGALARLSDTGPRAVIGLGSTTALGGVGIGIYTS